MTRVTGGPQGRLPPSPLSSPSFTPSSQTPSYAARPVKTKRRGRLHLGRVSVIALEEIRTPLRPPGADRSRYSLQSERLRKGGGGIVELLLRTCREIGRLTTAHASKKKKKKEERQVSIDVRRDEPTSQRAAMTKITETKKEKNMKKTTTTTRDSRTSTSASLNMNLLITRFCCRRQRDPEEGRGEKGV